MVNGHCGSRVVQRRENYFCQGHFDPGWGSENKDFVTCHREEPPGSPETDKERQAGKHQATHREVDNFLSSPLKPSSWTEHKFPLRVRQAEWGHSGNGGPRVGKESKAWKELDRASPSRSSWRTFFPPREKGDESPFQSRPTASPPTMVVKRRVKWEKAEQLPGYEQLIPASTVPLIPRVLLIRMDVCHIRESLLWPPTYHPLHLRSPTSKDEMYTPPPLLFPNLLDKS